MLSLSHLQNFPFDTMEELSLAFNKGTAEPVIPKDFAREWSMKNESSSIQGVTKFCFSMPFLLAIGMIVFSYLSENIKWYDTVIALIISLIIFHPMASKNFGIFRKLLIYFTIGLCIYFFVKSNQDFGILTFLSLVMLFFFEFTYYLSLQEIIKRIVVDEDLLFRLWDTSIMAIRYKDGKVIFKDKQLNPKEQHGI